MENQNPFLEGYQQMSLQELINLKYAIECCKPKENNPLYNQWILALGELASLISSQILGKDLYFQVKNTWS